MHDRVAPERDRTGVRPGFVAYVAVLAAAAATVLPAGLRAAAEAPLEALLWIGFIAASNLLAFQALPKVDIDVSLSAPLSVASAVLLPPPYAVLVNLVGFTNERELRRQSSLWMSLFNRSQVGLSAGAAALAVQQAPVGDRVVTTVLAVVVYNVVNIVFITAGLWISGRLRPAEAAKGSAAPFPRFVIDYGIVALLAVFIVVAYETAGAWAIPLLALPLWLGYSALKSARESEDRAEELAVRVRELETLHEAATELLASRTPRHAAAVARHALATALDTDRVEVVDDGVSEGLRAVPVQGTGGMAFGVPPAVDERAMAVVEAVAGLLGMTLMRQGLEQELAEVQRARAALSSRILEEATRERSRVALALHDDVLPAFAAAQIQADNVVSAVQAGAVGPASALAASTREAVEQGIARLREVLEDFRRQIIVPGGLRQGLADALEELKLKHGVDGKLRAPTTLEGVPFAVEILLLETTRGCLANVVRHARADSVEVAVETAEGAIILEIRDDGCGFEPAEVPTGHHGLVLMRQRVELARGRFVVTSGRGQGTHVHVEVPL